ncbi:hypothetical protein BaRGS_00023430 [Batillaria attramentaria]|uniref:XK-related protein n=1 Tax=Batillaria attramentaria TaxID=370345 RepID=A0ABD0KE93_9CAEN
MAQRRLSVLDVILTIVSLLTLLLDVGTDILVTVGLYLDGHLVWGSLMVAFIVLPLLVMNVLSLKWHAADQSLTCLTVLPHAFLVSPIQRYIQVVRFGMLSRLTGHPRYTDAALREQNDVCILRLVETFMESAPQLVLQLYIMLQTPAHVNWLHGLSAACSLVSLAWAMTAYSDTLRLAYQTTYQRRLVALVLHCLWQLTMVAARMAALVLFAFVFKAWVCLFAGLHWIAMTTCICITGTDFGSGKVERFLFRVVSGFIYIFVFLNLHDGPSRGRMGAYYCLMLLENAVLYAVWVIYGHNEIQVLNIAAPVIVFGGFLVGAVFLMIYYRWLHPSGPNYLFSLKTAPSLSQQHRRSRQPAMPWSQHGRVACTARTVLPTAPWMKRTAAWKISTPLLSFTPSPPLRSVLQRSRHSAGGHSWMDTPESWKEQPLPDTPWRLDYLNLDPAPPVEREAYFHRYDPRDVVIDLLLDQLKRASLRSNRSRPELSPLRLSHMQESPQRLGRNVDLFDRRAWRNLFMDNTGSAGPSHYSREEIHRLKEALDLIEMQQSPRVYRRQTPETASPEMYVSGQYRPPICTGGRREQMASQKHAGAPSASRPGPQQYSQRPVLDMPLNMSDHRSPRADDHHRRVRHRSEDVHTPTEEKHGLYRYFVGSDSPATAAPPCTPHWNTPVNTTTTPTQRHLLRRYLSENQAAGDSQVLRKAQQSVAATKSLRPSSVIQEVEQGARRPLHRPYSASYQDRKSVPQDSSFDRSMSRRQPLQTLDNSPSLSPDSACNQPVADDSEPLKPRTSRSGRRSVDPISDSSDSRYLRPTVQPHRSTSHSSGAAAGVAKKKSSTGHLR